MDELLSWREEFPILDKTVYMISHSLGAMPRRTRDRLQEYADMWSTRGIRSWEEGWWMMPTMVGDEIGKIIGAGKGEVVMHPNVSICQSVITSSLDFSGKRNKIVSEGFNFPSNLYIYNAMKNGARLVTVADDGTPYRSIECSRRSTKIRCWFRCRTLSIAARSFGTSRQRGALTKWAR
jgi:kynureninase